MVRTLSLVSHLLQDARRLLASGQRRAAKGVLRRLDGMALDAADAGRVKMLLGKLALRRGDHRRAARLFSLAAALRPDCPRVAFLLGLANADDPAIARTHFLRSLELSPDQPRALAEAGLCAVHLGEEEGIDQLRRAVSFSSAFRFVRMLAQGLCDAGRPEEARSAVNAARFLVPKCPRLRGLLLQMDADGLRRKQALPVAPDAGPVLLPFVRPEGMPARTRRDTPAILPGPHAGRAPNLRLRRPS